MQENSADSQQQTRLHAGLLLAVIGTGLFALKSIFIKLAFAQGVDATTLLMLRMGLSAPFYLLMLIWLWRKPDTYQPMLREWLGIIVLGFMGYYFSSWLDMQGLNYLSAQLERLTLYTYPIMTTLLGWLWLKERITTRIVLALIFTYTGVLVLYWHEAHLTGNQVSLGVALVMGAALTFSGYVVFSKALIGRLGSRLFTSIAMLASTFFVLVHFSVTHHWQDLQLTKSVWGYALLLAFVCTIIPSFMVNEAIARIGAARTSIVGTVGPIVTVLLAVALLGEPFGWFHLAGMVLVMAGVSLLGKA